MSIRFHFHAALLGFALAVTAASAQTRMQVSASSIPIHVQATAASRQIGTANSGEILFVTRTEGDWAAIAPPARLNLWLNKDFIEGNRVIAKSIQVRSGPGIQYEVIGTLERGALVMPRGEEGEWCKIEPPSSMVVWVNTSGLTDLQRQTTPIREVATVPLAAASPPVPAAPAVPSAPPATPESGMPAPPAAAAPAPPPAPVAKIAPSTPGAPPSPAQAPAPAPALVAAVVPPANPIQETPPAVAAPAPPPKPAAPKPVAKPRSTTVPAAPTLRPATGIPAQPAAPAAKKAKPAAPAAQRRTPMPAVTKSIPATAATVSAQKPRDLGVEVDPALVDELSLTDEPGQGKPVQVEGELRNAPFLVASPSRYRLQGEDEDGNLEFICHIHGDSNLLRGYVGQGVAIRGREYWVEESDMPVVVVGQIVPLAPTDEPVMY